MLAGPRPLLLTEVVLAETVYVLESFYEISPERVRELMRSAISAPGIRTTDAPLFLRALEVHEQHRLHFAEALLVAHAEASGVNAVASFDRSLDRVESVQRIEP